jgi:tetratricopeptide (TPR) repeat protein
MIMSPRRAGAKPALDLRLPVAVVRFWDAGGGPPPAVLPAALPANAGIHVLAEDRFLVLPAAGDPAIFDTAVHWCRRLLAGGATAGQPSPLAALITPTEAIASGSGVRPVANALSEDLDRRPPQVEAGRIYLTAWAARILERSHTLEAGTSYQGPSGTSVPLMEVGRPAPSLEPWRNPEIFNRPVKLVERQNHGPRLSATLGGVGVRLEGPLGCGKSRLVAACLDERAAVRLWLQAQPARRGGPSLLAQIAGQLLAPTAHQRQDPHHPRIEPAELNRLRGLFDAARKAGRQRLNDWLRITLASVDAGMETPLHLVIDDAEQLEPGDLDLASGLLQERGKHGLRLIFAGRARTWPPALESLPRIELPPLDEEEMGRFAERLLAGLSLPEPVRERLVKATNGFPFALEEGMIELIREKEVRRIYGSFFFGGQESAHYRPSLRLVCHVEAEAARLGAASALRLAALAGVAVPAGELATAAEIHDRRPTDGWDARALAAGLAQPRETPWGDGIAPACPAFGRALVRSTDAETGERAQRLVGELLAARGGTGEAHWAAYKLLENSAEGVAALLEAVQSSFGKTLGREETLAALTAELKSHQERGGHAAMALKLLWQILPVARRLGRLNEYEEELAFAVEAAANDPRRLLALASVKAELEQEAGRYDEAEATIQGALKLAKGIDLRRQALLLIQLGRLFVHKRRYDEARQLFDSLRHTLEQQKLPPLAASCRFYLGNIAMHENKLEEAARHHHSALEARRAQNLPGPAGLSLSAMGAVDLARGHYPQALAAYEQAYELLVEHGKPTDVSYTLMGVGRTLSLLGDYTAATKPLRRALKLRAGRDDVAGESIAQLEVAKNYLHLGRPDAALKEAREALFRLELLSLPGPTADAEALLGRIHLAQRQYERSRKHLATALATHRSLDLAAPSAFDLAWLLDVALGSDDAESVRRYAIDLKALVDRADRMDMAERLQLRMFRGLEYLGEHGHKVMGARVHLETAYREVLRKAAHLEPEDRHRFLLQIEDNQAILDAAARLGLTTQPETAAG